MEAVRGKRRRLHDGHPDTLQAVSNLGALLYARGDVSAAEPLFREVQWRYERNLILDNVVSIKSTADKNVIATP